MSFAISTSAWIEEQRRGFAHAVAERSKREPELVGAKQDLREIPNALRDFFQGAIDSDSLPFSDSDAKILRVTWKFTCDILRLWANHRAELRPYCQRHFGVPLLVREIRDYLRELDSSVAALIDTTRVVLMSQPEWGPFLPADLEPIVWTVRIPPLAYLRAMWNLFWSAIRHPLSDTTIDLSTGRVLYRT